MKQESRRFERWECQSIWLLTLNIARRRHILGFEADNAARLYRRERDGESLTRRKYILRD